MPTRCSRGTGTTRSTRDGRFRRVSEPVTSYTADRREFLGRNGDVADPAALRRAHLAEATGAGLDPCATLQCEVTLDPARRKPWSGLLGAATGEPAARALIAAYRSGSAGRALAAGRAAWRKRLSVTVRTPDAELNAMLNGWLLYQALACRMWARTALYQSSGAYGFRDQLQDCMAFVYAEPVLARAHIVRSAGRQFVEGDVQHWWHPQSGRGVRTRFSDDLAWLPFVTDHYVTVTGDTSVLDERAPYLTTRALAPGEVELYDRPEVSGNTGTVYDHCVRALRRASTVGAHGLPLIGCGDWNDGFSRVGIEGRGESVWLAWFLATTLRRFARGVTRGATSASAELRSAADAYAAAIERDVVGWRMVSPRLFRRRHPARQRQQRRVQDRLDRAELERDFRRRASRPGTRPCSRSSSIWCARTPADHVAHAAVRQDGARSGLHQRLSAWRARERRAVHARCHVGRAGAGNAGGWRPCVRAVPNAQPADALAIS